jgi:hypothetical protein
LNKAASSFFRGALLNLTYARDLISWRDAEVVDHLGPLEILL